MYIVFRMSAHPSGLPSKFGLVGYYRYWKETKVACGVFHCTGNRPRCTLGTLVDGRKLNKHVVKCCFA